MGFEVLAVGEGVLVVGVGTELRVTEVDGEGVGSGAAAAVPAVAATTAASTTDPAVTRIQGAQRTTLCLPVKFHDAHEAPGPHPCRTNHLPR